jgi:hypothetical protein
MKYVVFGGTMNCLFHLPHGGVRSGFSSSRPKTATSPKMVEKVKDLIATRYIAKCVGNSVLAAHTILRRVLKMRRISAKKIYPYPY